MTVDPPLLAPMPSHPNRRSWDEKLLPGLVLVALAMLGWNLGGADLIDPDEGRNAAIALEMSQSGSWLLPTLAAVPFPDKPLLYFASGALSIDLLGPTELAVRLPSLLATFALVGLIGWFTISTLGSRAGWPAMLVMATAPLSIAYSRIVIFDAMLSFFVVAALIAFFKAIEAPRTSQDSRRWNRSSTWSVVAWLAMALGILTKGPVALAVPLIVALPFAFWRRRILAVLNPFGGLIFVGILVPWLWATELRLPGFLHYALVTETWERLTTDSMQRTGPPWYYLPYLIGGALPWSLVLLGVSLSKFEGWRRRLARDPQLVYLTLWIVVPLLFFSLSHSKRPHYILPLIPALAILFGRAWARRERLARGVRWGASAWLFFGTLFLAAAAGWLPIHRMDAHLQSTALATAWLLALTCLGSGLAAWIWCRRPPVALALLAVPMISLPIVIGPLLSLVSEGRSTRELSVALTPHLTDGIRVVGIETFSPSLEFYLGQPVEISSNDLGLLRSNYVARAHPGWGSPGWETLTPSNSWIGPARDCAPALFVLQVKSQSARAALEATGRPLLFESDRFLAFGTCPEQPAQSVSSSTPPTVMSPAMVPLAGSSPSPNFQSETP
ncbi:MAG: glycosyltransferase family 39 protein [Thermoanaerobaculia bacterium]|nr:glycosyltransferase family 39 protein [Thermoanaerobaculia bacterium]